MSGVLSSLPKMAVGFCPVEFCSVGFCPSGVLSQWVFVRSPVCPLHMQVVPVSTLGTFFDGKNFSLLLIQEKHVNVSYWRKNGTLNKYKQKSGQFDAYFDTTRACYRSAVNLVIVPVQIISC